MMLVMRVDDSIVSARSGRSQVLMRSTNLILAVAVTVCPLAAQSQKPVAPKSKTRFAGAIDQTLAQGHDAILPPHVSTLLGISKEQEVPVKQFVEMGELIRGFEISMTEHNDVVIFVEKRLEKETTYYLTSQSGDLRRVLAVRGGVGYARQPSKDDKDSFQKEKQTWVDKLVPKLPR